MSRHVSRREFLAPFAARLLGALLLAIMMCADSGAGVMALVPGRSWALVIAVDKYSQWPQRRLRYGAEQDARRLADVLRTHYGFAADRIIELYGDNASSQEILRASNDLQERLRRGDSLVLVLSVRFESGGSLGPMLTPADASQEARWALIPFAEFQSNLASSGALMLTLVEACPEALATTDSSPYVANAKQAAQYSLNSVARRSLDVISGCNPYGSDDDSTFLGEVSKLLDQWQPPSAGRGLNTAELFDRLQKDYGFLQTQRNSESRQSAFAFRRQLPSLDPAIEARIKNRSADQDSRLGALAELARAIASAAGDESRRAPGEQVLLQLANDSTEDPEIRAAAVGYLGQLKVTEAQSPLQAIVASDQESAALRTASLDALSLLAGGTNPELLAPALASSNSEVAVAAVKLATKLPSDQARSVLLGWLSPERPSDALFQALRSLQLIDGPADDAVGPALAIVKSKADPEVRRQAIGLLSKGGSAQALDPLMSIVTNSSEPTALRQEATYAIGKLTLDDSRRAAAANALHKVSMDKEAGVRRAAADSLGRLKVPASREPLQILLEKDRVPEVRAVAAIALGRLGDRSASRALVRALDDREANVRSAAASALGEVGDVEDIEALLPLTRDSKNPEVQVAANRSLDRLKGSSSAAGDSSQLQIWSEVIQRSKDPGERARAIRRLPDLDDPRLAALLVESLRDNDPRVRYAAITRLASLSGTRGVDQLGIGIGDRNDVVSTGAAAALGLIGRSTAVDTPKWSRGLGILVAQPRGRNADVAAAIARALGAYVDPRAFDALAGYAESEERQVRIAAADAYRSLGEGFYKAGAMDRAIGAGQRAVDLRIQLSGEVDEEVATEFNNLGVYLQAKGDYKGAEQQLVRALSTLETASKRDGRKRDMSVALTNLATLREAQKDYKYAETLYYQALLVRQQADDPDENLIAQSRDKLIRLYRTMGDNDRADKLAKEAASTRSSRK
ncbi:MAG TPA: HEAT repeat domain-containing protein [Steroidobacteraceae bacterium]|nr:HEAT repeat domain-containing protein [Steroidobacteraceae bacterium]